MNELGAEFDWHARGAVVNGPDPSTDTVACLEYGYVDTAVVQCARRGEPRSAGADDQNVGLLGHLLRGIGGVKAVRGCD